MVKLTLLTQACFIALMSIVTELKVDAKQLLNSLIQL